MQVLLVDEPDEAPGNGEPSRDEGVVDQELRVGVVDLAAPPGVDLGLRRLEAALHAGNRRVDYLLAVDAFRVLPRNGREVAAEGQVVG